MPNGIYAWGMSPSKYVNQSVKNYQSHLTEKLNDKYKIPTRADNPFPANYCPDTDATKPLDPECLSFYQHLIGVMRWMVELGRVDIATKISMLWSYLAYPCEGHLEAAIHVMGYLRLKHNSQLIFDPTYPDIDLDSFPSFDWTEFYGDVTKAILTNMPKPLGKEVDIGMMVDSDHTGDKQTRRSRTGFLIYCNMVLIIWLSKRQPTIETFVFGAKFLAMKHGIKTLRGLRYKLQMMGVPLTGPSFIYWDNKSQVTNSSRPESTLKKKCNSICYHANRELVAICKSLITHIQTWFNLADFLTKVTNGAMRRRLVGNVLFDIYDNKSKHVYFDIHDDKANR